MIIVLPLPTINDCIATNATIGSTVNSASSDNNDVIATIATKGANIGDGGNRSDSSVFFPHTGVVYSVMTTDRLTGWTNRNESILTERQALRRPASGKGGA
jgi:hypothetical protein